MSKLQYFGHSCFKIISDDGYEIVFDPYQKDSVPGVQLPENFSAHAVYCSHKHGDHYGIDEVKIVPTDLKNPYTVQTLLVPHDDQEGKLRGMNLIHILQNEKEKIAHFGDLGRMLTEEESKALQNCSLIMIPCGGFYTIDAEVTRQIIARIQPKLAVLMHYRKDAKGYDVIASITDVMNVIPDVRQLETSEIDLSAEQGIITLEPYCD